MNGGGKRDLFASPSGADHAQVGSLARQLAHLTGRFRVFDRYGTAHQCPPSLIKISSTYIEIPIENHHLVIHNPSPISALDKWQEIMFWEYRFIFHDPRQICVSGRFCTLPSSKMNVDEAKRSIIDDHSSDDGSLVSIDSTYTPFH
jgi:hypothetical protein